MKAPTGKLAFAYRTIANLEAERDALTQRCRELEVLNDESHGQMIEAFEERDALARRCEELSTCFESADNAQRLVRYENEGLVADNRALAQRCAELEVLLKGTSESYALRCDELQKMRAERDTLRAEVERMLADNADLKAQLLEAERGAEKLVRLRALLRAAGQWMRNGEQQADALLAEIEAAVGAPR